MMKSNTLFLLIFLLCSSLYSQSDSILIKFKDTNKPRVAHSISSISSMRIVNLSSADNNNSNWSFTVSPNPFKEEITFDFVSPFEREFSLKIYDISGFLVFEDRISYITMGANKYTWQGINNAGSKLSSGIYLVELRSVDFVLSNKIAIAR